MSCNLITENSFRKCHATWFKRTLSGNGMQPDYRQLLLFRNHFRKCHATWLQTTPSLLTGTLSGNLMQPDYREVLQEMSCNLITENSFRKCHATWLQTTSASGNVMQPNYKELSPGITLWILPVGSVRKGHAMIAIWLKKGKPNGLGLWFNETPFTPVPTTQWTFARTGNVLQLASDYRGYRF